MNTKQLASLSFGQPRLELSGSKFSGRDGNSGFLNLTNHSAEKGVGNSCTGFTTPGVLGGQGVGDAKEVGSVCHVGIGILL